MKKIKGCVSMTCVAKGKNTYKEDDFYCSKCGKNLVFVCKKCMCELSENDGAYCIVHQAERDDRKEKAIDGVKKVGSGVLVVAGAIGSVAKTGIGKVHK